MNDFKNLTRLYMMMDIGNRVMEGSYRGLMLIRRWCKDGKITSEMMHEFADEVDVDEETKSKIENLKK